VKIPTFFDWEKVNDDKSLQEVAYGVGVTSNLFDNGKFPFYSFYGTYLTEKKTVNFCFIALMTFISKFKKKYFLEKKEF
jgi:hypothetical protein